MHVLFYHMLLAFAVFFRTGRKTYYIPEGTHTFPNAHTSGGQAHALKSLTETNPGLGRPRQNNAKESLGIPFSPYQRLKTLCAREPQPSVPVPTLAPATSDTSAVAQPPSHTLCAPEMLDFVLVPPRHRLTHTGAWITLI